MFKIIKNVLLWRGQSAGKIKSVLLVFLFLSLIAGFVLYKVVFILHSSVMSSFWTFYGIVVSVFLLSRIPIAYLYEDEHDIEYPDSVYPSVSIIIATKNEEAGIFKTIATCIESQYAGKLECIVINDGSTDNTKDEIIRAQERYGDRVKLIDFIENRGKREAMAIGVNESQNEIIVFVDSDSFLAPDALRLITEHFLADKKIGAVSGNTKVDNANTNLLTKMQSIQYAISFDVYKACESFFRSVTCCPGCFSAYRKIAIEPFIEAWKEQRFLGVKKTFGDDRGLTNWVLRAKWDIVYCEKAKATTVAPDKFSVYWRQQLRWKKSWIREGLFAGTFMWKRHPIAALSFYVQFSFPFFGPILAAKLIFRSLLAQNLLLLLIFVSGFILVGMVFSLFVRIYRGTENWMYMPLLSLLFVSVFIWQMLYAIATLRKGHWGTR
jgi:hyaluronan synthase